MEQMSEILTKEFVYNYLVGVDGSLANNFLTKIGEVWSLVFLSVYFSCFILLLL